MPLILLADDDDEFRATLREMLERWGHTVIEASNGRVALEILESTAVDLLILDIIMPELEGMETLFFIRNKYKALKVLVISGGGRLSPDEYLQPAVLMGAKAALRKPFTGEALKSALQTLGF